VVDHFIIGRAVRDDVSPAALNFLRWAIALLILVPITLRDLQAHRATLVRHWKLIALLGFTGIAAFQTLGYVALTMTTALNTILLLALAPLAIVALSWLTLGERVTRVQALGLGISLVGAAVLILHGDPATLAEMRFNAGDLWMLLAVVLWAVYSVLLRRARRSATARAAHDVRRRGNALDAAGFRLASNAWKRASKQHGGLDGSWIYRRVFVDARPRALGTRRGYNRSESRRRVHSPDSGFRRRPGGHIPG